MDADTASDFAAELEELDYVQRVRVDSDGMFFVKMTEESNPLDFVSAGNIVAKYGCHISGYSSLTDGFYGWETTEKPVYTAY